MRTLRASSPWSNSKSQPSPPIRHIEEFTTAPGQNLLSARSRCDISCFEKALDIRAPRVYVDILGIRYG
jgi:hypothetical protein